MTDYRSRENEQTGNNVESQCDPSPNGGLVAQEGGFYTTEIRISTWHEKEIDSINVTDPMPYAQNASASFALRTYLDPDFVEVPVILFGET